MLSLMLNLVFKSLRLVSSFVGRKEGVSIVNEYDTKTLYFMFLKCNHHFHQMTKFVGCVNQEDFSMDIFHCIHKQAIKRTCH
jgi:hypothetical protein